MEKLRSKRDIIFDGVRFSPPSLRSHLYKSSLLTQHSLCWLHRIGKDKKFVAYIKDIRRELLQLTAEYSALFQHRQLYEFLKYDVPHGKSMERVWEFDSVSIAGSILNNIFKGREGGYDRCFEPIQADCHGKFSCHISNPLTWSDKLIRSMPSNVYSCF